MPFISTCKKVFVEQYSSTLSALYRQCVGVVQRTTLHQPKTPTICLRKNPREEKSNLTYLDGEGLLNLE